MEVFIFCAAFIICFHSVKHLSVTGKVFELERINIQTSQPTFTCSKLTIEALKNGVKYVQN